MKKIVNSARKNIDKKFVVHLTAMLKAYGNKVEVQYLCSAPSSISEKKD